MKEEWKPVEGAPDYLVSNLGRVKSFRKEPYGILLAIHTPVKKKWSKALGDRVEKSYPNVGIIFDGRTKSTTTNVHRLVAKAFVKNPYNLPLVNHIDGDKTNNRADNLEWTDQSGNHKHAFRTGLRTCPVKGENHPGGKLTAQQVEEIRALKGKMTQYKIAEKYGINQSNVCRIQSGERWVA